MIRGLLLAAMVSLLGACGNDDVEHREKVYIFGTLVEFVIKGVDVEDARQAVSLVERDFQRMHKDWHAWKPGELTDLNLAFSQGVAKKVTPFLLPLVVQAKDLYELSDGLFNPAIGGLVAAWGFHADELPKGSLPPLDEIKALAAKKPRMSDVSINGGSVSSSNPTVSLDFGGFAKGVALDRAVALLKKRGIKQAIVNAGGDLNTLGRAGDRPWKIGIRHPVNWGVLASIEMRDDENLYTSGNYERYREHEGIRYAHILDPRDGMPVNHIVSASVIHASGAVADAAATALTVAGPDDWHRIAKKMGVKFAMVVDEKGVIYANPAMKERLIFAEGEPLKLILSPPL